MANIAKQLQELNSRLDTLRNYQKHMQEEITRIEQTLLRLHSEISEPPAPFKPAENISAEPVPEAVFRLNPDPVQSAIKQSRSLLPQHTTLETFIGTNLISKLGILITIIGVFVGARYAIDRELISPATRIILAYVFALILSAVGLKLKKNYTAFSAVLIGGSIAIIYFSTFIGYGYFKLIPQLLAFILMFVTTLTAVALALWYNQKIIALIGQVAAYAIPILLSDGSGKMAVLFSYITIINAGLIVLSFKKNWKIIYRIAFAITWSIFFWFIQLQHSSNLSWNWTLLFISLCFISFYITYLSYKIFRKELYNIGEISVLLMNAIFYYYLGYLLIDRQTESVNALTIFTLANAVIHLVAGYGIHRLKLADESVRLFLFGQGLAFATIAIPVRLDGSWVTLLWSVEAAILLYIASKQERKLYYQLATIVLCITVISLLEDWVVTYDFKGNVSRPFLNQTFLTTVITCGCFFYASLSGRRTSFPFKDSSHVRTIFNGLLPLIFMSLLYTGIFLEISSYYTQTSTASISPLGVSVLHIYSALFVGAAIYVNNKYVRDKTLYTFLLAVSLVALFLQLTSGLSALSELRSSSMAGIRYINFAAVALLWWTLWQSKLQFNKEPSVMVLLSVALNITMLTIISNEYLHWVSVSGSSSQYKLGLSIIFGGYALVMLFLGLIRNIKHLRISAIVLFGLTIIKLFIYDLQSVSTIGKTIVLIMLGVLLLTASFLYNKYLKKGISEKPTG